MTKRSMIRASSSFPASAVIAISVVVGICLRYPVVLQQFWLDEIWSYYLTQDARSVWYIIADLTHSNNHILNSLFMWLLGDQPSWVLYRLLSLTTGVITVAALGFAGKQVSRTTGYLAAILGACSVPLILYSGEARGYAPVALFAVLALLLLPEPDSDEGYSVAKLSLFWSVSILGILSQITYAIVLAGLAISWVVRHIKSASDPGLTILRAAKIFVVPGVVGLLVVANIFGDLQTEQGNQSPALEAAVQIYLESVGLGYIPRWPVAATGLAAAILLSGSIIARDKGLTWLLVALVIPGTLFSVVEAPYMFPRYFMVSVPFFILAAATLVGWIWERRQHGGAIVAATFTAVMLVGSATDYVRLVTHGKGDYISGIRTMSNLAGGNQFTVGSDHDFRNLMVLTYYSRYVDGADRMTYVRRNELHNSPPNFFLTHSFEFDNQPASQIRVSDVAEYAYVESFRHSGHSGWTWHLYRQIVPSGSIL